MIIFCDLDGTLIDDFDHFNKKNIDYLKNNHMKDFVLVTGRNFTNLFNIMNLLDINCDIIGGNGSFHKRKNEDIKVDYIIDKKYLNDICKIIKKEGVIFIISTPLLNIIENSFDIENSARELASAHVPENSSEFKNWVNGYREIFIKNTNFVENIETFFKNGNYSITKIEILSSDVNKLNKIKYNIEKKFSDLAIEKSYLTNIEIVNKEANKGAAIKAYLKERNLSKNNTISIGNNYNDQSMFNETEYSFAVSNSIRGLKNVKYLESSNLGEFFKEIDKTVKTNVFKK